MGGRDSCSTDTLPPLLTRVGRRRKRVWLGSRIDFLGQTGTHVAITAWSTMFSFFPSLFLLAFLFFSPFLSPCFFLVFLSFVLLHPCSSLSDLLVSFVFCFTSEFIFLLSILSFSWSFLCCCVLVPGTLALRKLDPYLRLLFVLSIPLSYSL